MKVMSSPKIFLQTYLIHRNILFHPTYSLIKRSIFFLQLLTIIILTQLAESSNAANLLVSTDCSIKSKNGVSASSCFGDIASALELVDAGDTIWLDDGTYSGDIYIDKSGQENFPIKISSIPGTTPVINNSLFVFGKNAAHIIANGLTIKDQVGKNGIEFASLSESITVQNCTIHSTDFNGILLKGDGHLLTNNTIYRTGMRHSQYKTHGIYIKASNSRIINNTCFDSLRGNGIRSEGNNILIEGNDSYSNYSTGISVFSDIPTSGIVIANNTVYKNGKYGIAVLGGANGNVPQNIDISDNTISEHYINVVVLSGIDVTSSNNTILNSGKYHIYLDNTSAPTYIGSNNNYLGDGFISFNGGSYTSIGEYTAQMNIDL